MNGDAKRRLEEISMNAWPSLKSYIYDGWVFRYANNYTKRANSVVPLYPSQKKIDEKIRHVETLFAKYNMRKIFKLTDFSEPGNLDLILEQRGYVCHDETSVQALELRDFSPRITRQCYMDFDLDSGWLEAFSTLSHLTEEQTTTLGKMLNNGFGQNVYFSIRQNGGIAACGLGVKDQEYLGIFDIVVSQHERRQGYGTLLMHCLVNWAKNNACTAAYLQIVVGNTRAENLYKKLGFQEQYRYWYRIKQT